MKLRPRLALTVAGVVVPTMLAIVWFDRIARHRAAEQILERVVESHATSTRAACEAAPETWGGRMRPPERDPSERGIDRRPPALSMHPSPDRDARPPFPPPRRGPHERPPGPDHGPPGPPPPDGDGDEHATPAVVFAYDENFASKNPAAPAIDPALVRDIRAGRRASGPSAWSSNVDVLVRTSWGTGPCAFVYGRGSTDPSWGRILPKTPLWLLPLTIVFAAVLLALGPVVRRIRKLEGAVRAEGAASEEPAIDVAGNDEIAELARAFVNARREVRKLLAEKEERERALHDFIANTTHDVMIPLTVLKGHLTTLRERRLAGLDAPPEVLGSAMNEAHYLGALVHNLSSAVHLDEQKLLKSPVDLVALVERVVARHEPIAKTLGVSIERAVPADPAVVSADVTLLEQAVGNVTYNAVRYNHEGGHVALILERRDDGGYELRVLDDGPGMTPEEIARVERGVRGDAARTRAPDGRGLGLHIATRAAELHGFAFTLGPSEFGGLEAKFEIA